MYIIVEAKTNKIVGCANKPVDELHCSHNGQKVFNIPDDEYSHDMLGTLLEDFQPDTE